MLSGSALFRDELRPRGRVLAILLLALLTVVLPVAAQDSPEQPASDDQRRIADQRAILSVTVNHVDKGEILVVLRGKDALASVAALERAGITGFAGRRETIDGEAFVSLASLAPAIVFAIDDRALTLSLTAQPDLLPATRLTLTSNRPAGLQYAATNSAFLNYGVNWWQTSGYDASVEMGAHLGGALALSTMTWNPATGAVRGQTGITIDQRDNLRRWNIGDTFVASRLFGSSVYLAGVRVSREYSLDPYFVRYPQPAMSGSVLTPSTMEVYVNDRLVSRTQVAPGKFELSSLPLPAGSSQARVVIRDAFGREQQMTTPFYLTMTALAQGLSDYDYAVGVQRVGVGARSWTYDRLSVVGSHRYGMTDSLTPGIRFEADASRFSGGPSLNARLPFGEVEFTGAVSRDGSYGGGAIGVAFAHVARTFSAAVSARAMSRGYSTLTLSPRADRSRLDISAYGSMQVNSRASISLQQLYRDSYLAGTNTRTGLIGTVRLTARSNVVFGISRTRADGLTAHEASVSVGIFLSNRAVASVSATRTQAGTSPSLELQRSLPSGTGYGYRLQLTNATGGFGSGALEYQGRFGRYELGQEMVNGQPIARFAIAGGLATVGGPNPQLSRPLSESFALVRVPGVARVRAFAENQEIGRTNANGDLLIPNLLAYYGNRLSIADQDVPLDHDLGETAKVIAPPYRGGALVVFQSGRIQITTGRFVVEAEGREVVPAYGELRLTANGKEYVSPLGGQGEFYLENVPAGTHSATVRYDDTSCTVSFEVPKSELTSIALGTRRCVAQRRQQ